ncbi:PilN domain-containing protein [Lysinibacillus sp. 54212]|uniref:PilN domain-containing protein n=1 Tax=Lysinibacillus sp. 54212 TaxID=3119829 RepID=UPI002FCC6D58
MIPDINLMPKLEKGETSSKLLYVLLGIVVLLGLVVLSWMYVSAKSNLSDLTSEQAELEEKRIKLEAELSALQTMNQGSLEESVAFVELVSYPVSPLIDETQGLLPENTYLREYEFGESSVTIKVDFETLNEVSTYVSRLENSPYFIDSQVGTIENFELDPAEEGESEEVKFNEVPRYSVEVMLMIDIAFVAVGGGIR